MSDTKKGNPIALLPIGIFIILYLGLGILFEYVLNIEMGFYNVPIVVVFLVALGVACAQNPSLHFNEKLDLMGQGIGDRNIVIMLLIFLEAGIFVGVVGRGSAQSVAYCLLSIVPKHYAVATLFIIACLVSVSMGTSVGTITLIVPIGVSLAQSAGCSVSLCVAAVVGGAMFGDNLSFISDTTIAACNGQGCQMKDKFRANFKIALPAAIISVILLFLISQSQLNGQLDIPEYSLIQIIPYLLVLAGGILGFNVLLVLLAGILSGSVIMLTTGALDLPTLISQMGSGASSMFETVMVAVLVAAICALIREYGGFDALLYLLHKWFRGYRGGQIGIGILVVLLDIATANNTVAIVMANPIAKEMSEDYGIDSRKTASILDTFSCVAQGILPYGAQMLVAISAVAAMGENISAFEIIPQLFYPYLLLLSSVLFICFSAQGKKA